jgi:hypothetical protein
MTMTNVEQKVREYKGTNTFIKNIQPSLSKWGRLTQKQYDIANKILLKEERQGIIVIDELSDDLKTIMTYEGGNEFVLKMKVMYETYRVISDRQIAAAIRQIKKEKSPAKNINIPLNNESIKLKRGIALKLKNDYGLEFMPILVDLVKATKITEKAVRVSVKLTEENGDVCRCCGLELTDPFSILTGMGAICARHLGVKYIKDKNEVERFRVELKERIQEIGEFEFWLPKTQVREYVGEKRFRFIIERLWG